METLRWVGTHWLDLLQSVGIVGGLLFTVHTIRTDAKSRRVSNAIAFAHEHREIWKEMYQRPELARVTRNDADLDATPISDAERLFAELLISHLGNVHRATKENMFASLEGLQKDMRMSFASPVLRTVWDEMKEFQDEDFVEFVESAIR